MGDNRNIGYMVLASILAILVIPLISVIINTAVGAFMGWLLTYIPILGDAVNKVLDEFFPTVDIELWHIGALLGFIASFLNPWTASKNEEEEKKK